MTPAERASTPSALAEVTDHAVLRYLERAHGVPVEAVRLLLALSAAGLRDGVKPIGGRVKIVLENGIVVTCLKQHWTARERMPGAPRR